MPLRKDSNPRGLFAEGESLIVPVKLDIQQRGLRLCRKSTTATGILHSPCRKAIRSRVARCCSSQGHQRTRSRHKKVRIQ
jgi:hypothetical protein